MSDSAVMDPTVANSGVMDSTELKIEANKVRKRELLEELRNLKKQTSQKEAFHKAKKNLDQKRTYKSDQLTHKERKPNTVIKPEVCSLICENVMMKGMKVSEAMEAFNVSRRQIQRIKAEDPNNVKVQKKRPSKFTDDMKTELLLELDQKSTTTLPEMVAFIEDRFDVKVLTQAVSNLIHNMDISWKQVTNIPAAWNKPELIEQRANFVNCCGLDLGRKVVFVDESGFDLHLGRPFGYAPSGTVPFLCLFFFFFILFSIESLFFYCRPACCPQSCTKDKADNVNCCLIGGRI
jgi:transposase